MHYINFYFKKLVYDEETIMGVFISRDDDITCSFSCNRKTRQCDIWDNNKHIEEIIPLPVYCNASSCCLDSVGGLFYI